MGIQQFELFHGAVLTKLVRSDRPLTLRMIETHPDDAWAVYTINDQVDLLIKHSATPRELSREGGGWSWTFQFTADQSAQLRGLAACRSLYAALVCAQRDLKAGNMHVCLLDAGELGQLLDMDAAAGQPITVKFLPRKKLRVSSPRIEVDLLVSQRALDVWEVPGS